MKKPNSTIVLRCNGVPTASGTQAALDIADEFKNRPWHHDVELIWDGAALLLTAENDYDEKGLALLDELSDAIAACIRDGFNGSIDIVSVTIL
jgi:hypothetical protein